MPEFMRGHEIGQIYVILVEHSSNESDALGVGHGVRKGLGELSVTRELHDAVLRELVWAVVRQKVVEPGSGGGEHIVDVVGVGGVVVDLEIDRAVRTWVNLLAGCVA